MVISKGGVIMDKKQSESLVKKWGDDKGGVFRDKDGNIVDLSDVFKGNSDQNGTNGNKKTSFYDGKQR